jgi:hypothetical protein
LNKADFFSLINKVMKNGLYQQGLTSCVSFLSTNTWESRYYDINQCLVELF